MTRDELIARAVASGMDKAAATAKADAFLKAKGREAEIPGAKSADKPKAPTPKASTPATPKAPEPPKPGPAVKAQVPTVKKPSADEAAMVARMRERATREAADEGLTMPPEDINVTLPPWRKGIADLRREDERAGANAPRFAYMDRDATLPDRKPPAVMSVASEKATPDIKAMREALKAKRPERAAAIDAAPDDDVRYSYERLTGTM